MRASHFTFTGYVSRDLFRRGVKERIANMIPLYFGFCHRAEIDQSTYLIL